LKDVSFGIYGVAGLSWFLPDPPQGADAQ
jgi:hypothetical protein